MLRIVLVLAVVCFISGASLAATHFLTQEKIAEAEKIEINEALSKVFPSASLVENNGYYIAENRENVHQIFGYAAIAEGRGFGGSIKLLVGMDNGGRVKRIVIISHTETPGLGSRITEEGFLSQFEGRSLDELKLKRDGGKIDAVTGATISSKAVTDAVHDEIQELIKMLEGAM